MMVWCVFLGKKMVNGLKGFNIVIIVGIDNSKRFLYCCFSNQYSMCSFLWFFLVVGIGIGWNEVVFFLENVIDFDFIFKFISEGCFEGFFNIVVNDEYNFVKVCLYGVIDGIFDDGFFIRFYIVNLFKIIIMVIYFGS